jgi:putative transcriptional regulator
MVAKREKIDGMGRFLRALAVVALCGMSFLQAQSSSIKDLAAGKLLVAGRELGDPNFIETVILLVHYDKESTMGLVLNRRTRVPLSRVFDDLKAAKGRTDPVYVGGPVERNGVLALVRVRPKPEGASNVFADVHLISTKELLEKTVAAGTESGIFHVYLGYAGWGPGQLEHEVELGAWFIFRPEAGMVFDTDPETLWPRLIQQTELRIARALR